MKKTLTTDVFSDQELIASRDRLKRWGAVVIVSPSFRSAKMGHADSPIPAGFSGWFPDEMFSYITGTPKQRKLMRELKMMRQSPEKPSLPSMVPCPA